MSSCSEASHDGAPLECGRLRVELRPRISRRCRNRAPGVSCCRPVCAWKRAVPTAGIRAGTSLFRSVQELPEGIDLVCAALGRNASDVVLELLHRGLPVLCEHPQRPAFLAQAFQISAARGIPFHINGHFGDLPAAKDFIREGRRRREEAEPVFLAAMLTDRSLYGFIDILRRAVDRLEPCLLQVIGHSGPFRILEGSIRGIPVTLQVQGSVTGPETSDILPDASKAYLVEQRMELGFATGVLTQLSIAGPVFWNANYHAGMDPNEPLGIPLYLNDGLSARSFQQERAAANLHSMRAIAAQAGGGETPSEQTAEHILEVSNVAEAIGEILRTDTRR